jgi:hypothetical protein
VRDHLVVFGNGRQLSLWDHVHDFVTAGFEPTWCAFAVKIAGSLIIDSSKSPVPPQSDRRADRRPPQRHRAQIRAQQVTLGYGAIVCSGSMN